MHVYVTILIAALIIIFPSFINLSCLLIYQRLTSVSRTHIETGIYFRWNEPDVDDDASSAASSLLNDARLGSYVYDGGEQGAVADAAGLWSRGSGTAPEVLLDISGSGSSTDGNNNDVNAASPRRASSSRGQHVTDAVIPSANAQTTVS